MSAHSLSTLVDLVVLVFSRSELKQLVGTDALRMVLGGSGNALVPRPGELHLQPVWDLLETQPGFDPKLAIAPFCRLKAMELRLGIRIAMPAPLDGLDATAREEYARDCHVGDDDVSRIVNPPRPARTTLPPAARVVEAAVPSGPSQSYAKLIFAVVFALLAIAGAVVSYVWTMGGTSSGTTKTLAAGDLSTEIPLSNVRRSGDHIAMTVSDPKWIGQPEADRRRQLEAAAAKAQALAAKWILVLDPTGKQIAFVALKGRPQVTFTR